MRKSPTETARKRAARSLSRARWANTTPEERSAFAAGVAAHRTTPEQMGNAARRTDRPRCPCGEMTLKRAQARGHKCVAPAAPADVERLTA
jgi:hypothetical protein